jgi:uncharacterized domain HDIG
MGNFPVVARGYIWCVVILGWLALAYVLIAERHLWEHAQYLVGGCILAVAASNVKVPVVALQRAWRGEKSDNNSTMSLGFVPTYFMLLTFGPTAGMLVGAITALIPTLFPRRSYYYQILFSISALLLSVFTASVVLAPAGLARSLEGPVVFGDVSSPYHLVFQLAALIAGAFTYFFTNTILVATAISLTSGSKSPLQMWREHFCWTVLGYLAGASCATIANVQIPQLRSFYHSFTDVPVVTAWQSFIVLTVVSVPIPLVIYFVYRYHREKDDANLVYIENLERANAELERSRTELQELYTATVESFALAIDAKDAYTKQHINRVKDYAVLLAEEMGLRGDDLRAIEYGALLHDIGKLAIPEAILNKAGKLTDDEFEIVKEHPVKGVEILEPVRFPFPVLDVVRSHHERWDGKGYPDALAGVSIPMGGRILAVADVFDALTSDRSYRAGWSHARAIQYLVANKGTHFDPEVVDAFLRVLGQREGERDTRASGSGKDRDMTANSLPSEMREAVADGIDRVPLAPGEPATSRAKGFRGGCHGGSAAGTPARAEVLGEEARPPASDPAEEIADAPCAPTLSRVK